MKLFLLAAVCAVFAIGAANASEDDEIVRQKRFILLKKLLLKAASRPTFQQSYYYRNQYPGYYRTHDYYPTSTYHHGVFKRSVGEEPKEDSVVAEPEHSTAEEEVTREKRTLFKKSFGGSNFYRTGYPGFYRTGYPGFYRTGYPSYYRTAYPSYYRTYDNYPTTSYHHGIFKRSVAEEPKEDAAVVAEPEKALEHSAAEEEVTREKRTLFKKSFGGNNFYRYGYPGFYRTGYPSYYRTAYPSYYRTTYPSLYRTTYPSIYTTDYHGIHKRSVEDEESEEESDEIVDEVADEVADEVVEDEITDEEDMEELVREKRQYFPRPFFFGRHRPRHRLNYFRRRYGYGPFRNPYYYGTPYTSWF